MDIETQEQDVAHAKNTAKELRGKVGTWARVHDKTLEHPDSEPYRKLHDKLRLEVVQQWATLKNAMEQLGF